MRRRPGARDRPPQPGRCDLQQRRPYSSSARAQGGPPVPRALRSEAAATTPRAPPGPPGSWGALPAGSCASYGSADGNHFCGERRRGRGGSGSRSLSKFPARVSEPKSPQAQPRGCERGSRGSAPRGGVRNRLTAGGSLGIVVFPLSPPFIFEARFLCRRRGQARAWVFQLRSRRRGVGVSRSGSGARHARGFISRVGNGVEAAGSRQEAAAKAVLSGSRAGTRGTPQPPSLPLGCSLGSGQG